MRIVSYSNNHSYPSLRSCDSLLRLSFVRFFCRWVFASAKEPAVACPWGAIGGCYGAFSSPIYRILPHRTTPVSGGAHNMKYLVKIRAEPPLLPSAFDE